MVSDAPSAEEGPGRPPGLSAQPAAASALPQPDSPQMLPDVPAAERSAAWGQAELALAAARHPGGTVEPGPLQRRVPALASEGRRSGRLDLGDAIHDGWQAFCRAPWVFAGFALLVNLLILLQQPLLLRIGNVAQPSGDLRDWGLYGLGLAMMAAVLLWGCLGLGRGALLALQGQRPTLVQLLRWDGAAWLRLLRAALRLAAMVGLPAGSALVLFGLPLLLLTVEPALQRLLGQEVTRLLALTLAALLLLSLALTLVVLLYLLVNQAFLIPIVLLEGRGGGAAVERGRQLVDPQWPLVLLLVIAGGLLNGLGLLACVVGGLAAWPAVVCISAAAYRQLRDAEERGAAQAALAPPPDASRPWATPGPLP